MEQLTFSGRSLDGDHLLLKDKSGRTYALMVDTRLRTALRGQPERNGQLEIHMESTLRPRDIQARIRAGETAEAVAQAAGTSVDRIMAFAAPVLAERSHVAERAQLASVRRRAGDTGARTLGDAVAAHLRTLNTDPDTLEWDAFRREDGRWTLTGQFTTTERSGTATFSFDMRGNFCTVDDDDAHWLIGEHSGPAAPAAPTRSDDLAAARQRRLIAVDSEDVPLGEDAIELVTGKAEQAPHQPEESVDQAASATDSTLEFDRPLPPVEDEPAVETPADSAAKEEPTEQPAASASEPDSTAEATEAPAPRKPAKKRGRASVPSWDEIMFGGGKNE